QGGNRRRRRENGPPGKECLCACWNSWSPRGCSASLRSCVPSPTAPGTARRSATGAQPLPGSGGWSAIRTRRGTSLSSRRPRPGMRRRHPSFFKATWIWCVKKSPAAPRTWPERAWTCWWRTAASGRRAPP
ncbi:30S ribosome-binding factor RbfA, partial [Dysosmobacter welbionis]